MSFRKKKIKMEKGGKKKKNKKPLGITNLNKIYSIAPLIKYFTLCGETRLKTRVNGQVLKYSC